MQKTPMVRETRVEQYQLSVLLLQLLFKTFGKYRLDTDADDLSAYIPRDQINKKNGPEEFSHDPHLYDIIPTTALYNNTPGRTIRVQDGTRHLRCFGQDERNRTFFKIDGCDYLAILKDLTVLFAQDDQHKLKPIEVSYALGVRGPSEQLYAQQLLRQRKKIPVLPAHILNALANLGNKRPAPELYSCPAWDPEYINVIFYLKSVVKGNFKPK